MKRIFTSQQTSICVGIMPSNTRNHATCPWIDVAISYGVKIFWLETKKFGCGPTSSNQIIMPQDVHWEEISKLRELKKKGAV